MAEITWLHYFSFNPGSDIHLDLADVTRSSVTVSLLAYRCDSTNVPLPLKSPNITIETAGVGVIDPVANDGVIQALSVGTEYVRVRYNDRSVGFFHELTLRVTVHNGLNSMWVGTNGQAFVNEGSDNLVLPAYAEFSDGTIADVTGHGWMQYSIDPGDALTLAVDADGGRVTALKASAAPITVTGTFDAIDYDTQVEILPRFGTVNEIVEPIKVHGAGDQYTNVLFLAEGFTLAEKDKFEKLARRIADRMRRSKAHQPFKLLKYDMNYWMAFEASHESGVSMGHLVNHTDGSIGEFGMGNVPTSDDAPLQAKSSRYGLYYGQRLRSRGSASSNEPDFYWMDDNWYAQSPRPEQFSGDHNRSPLRVDAWYDDMFEYLGALKTRDAADPNYDIGERWGMGGKDQGRVIILVNDEYIGGIYLRLVDLGAVIPVNHKKKLKIDDSAAPKYDHVAGATSTLRSVTVAVAVHEFCHSFLLNDEYEAREIDYGSETDAGSLEFGFNTTGEIYTSAGGINQIKWNNYYRMNRSSAILHDAVCLVNTQLTVELFPGEGAKWIVGDEGILRTPNLNGASEVDYTIGLCDIDKPLYDYYPSWMALSPTIIYNFEVTNVAGDTLELTCPSLLAGKIVPRRSSFFQIKTYWDGAADQPMSLILPPVQRYLEGDADINGNPINPQGPLVLFEDKKGACAVPNTKVGHPHKGIAGIKYPFRKARLIGLYEGAGTFTCRAYRSSGVCKMRNSYNNDDGIFLHHVHLCHLSKYVIVNMVNASRHADLDKDYPGDLK